MTVSAIVLAAGKGSRMGGGTPKQYLEINGRPLIYYALRAFEESAVDEIVLVVSKGDAVYCRKEIVERYAFTKVAAVVEGGEERYDSVYAGLTAVRGDFVLIHDGARAFIEGDIISRAIAAVQRYEACAVGMPSKDTVKIVAADAESAGGLERGDSLRESGGTAHLIRETPERSTVWIVQTPQCFRTALVKEAYDKMFAALSPEERKAITDDAMVVERMTKRPVYMIEGSYENTKITTPEDLPVAEMRLKK